MHRARRSGSERDAMASLRKAARRLAPVWIELPAPHPRLEGFASEVRGRGAHATLIIAPVCAGSLPAQPVPLTVRSRAAEAPVVLRAPTAWAEGNDRLAIPLAGAQLGLMPDRGRARRSPHAAETLMLVVPGPGASHQVYPVVDLAASSGAIDAVAPLSPGTLLDPVEIVGKRHVLRVASAVVREAIPWLTARGEPRFRCRLDLGRPGREPADADGCLLHEPRRVRRVIELAAMMEGRAQVVPVDGNARRPEADARLLAAGRDRIRLAVDGDPDVVARLGRRSVVRLAFDLFAVSYEMDVRILEAGPDVVDPMVVEASFPLLLRQRRRRRRPRVELDGAGTGVTLAVRNPATGERIERPLLDASFGGFCFESDPAVDLLWSDLPLEDAALRWKGREAPLGQLWVRSVDAEPDGQERCHVELAAKERASNDPLLIDLLATFGHPELEVHDGEGFTEILDTYDQAQLLGPYMKDNLRPTRPAAAVHWRRLHTAPSHLVRTLIHRDGDGRPDATISSLRAWDRTWLIQHFGATSSDGFRWSGELQEATLDWIIPRTDGEYMLFFIHAANSRMNAFYQRFIELTGTPEAISQNQVQLFRLPADMAQAVRAGEARGPRESGVHPRVTVQPPARGERDLVARTAEARLGAMIADALGFRTDELELPGCAARFAEAGLERRRSAEVVRVGRRARIALLHEDLSPGVNLTWMQNASWVLPLGGVPTLPLDALPAALAALHRRSSPSPAGDRFVLMPGDVDGGPLTEAGWVHQLDARIYVLNRAGLHRYYHYVTDRYGEVGVRKAWRSAAQNARRATSETSAAG